MKHWDSLRAVLRSGRLLIGLILTLSLVGCSLGEAVMPNLFGESNWVIYMSSY